MVENLVNNAAKYGDRDTAVTITVKDTADSVSIHVHNHVEPIPMERQEDIFGFLDTSQGKRHRGLKSYGMGLALMHSVAKGHGGTLKLKSSKEEGTVFSLYLEKFRNKPGKRKVGLDKAKKSGLF